MQRLVEWLWLAAAGALLVLFLVRYPTLTGKERVILLLGIAVAAGLFNIRRTNRLRKSRSSSGSPKA